MNRILVIRGGAIGDFVLTLPAIKLLRDKFPRAHLEILGYKHIVALAENRFYANATRSLESAAFARFFAKDADLPEELIEYFAGFDLVVSYLFDPDKIFATNIGRTGNKNFLDAFTTINGDEPAAFQLARPLGNLALHLENPAAQIFPSEADRAFASDFLTGLTSRVIALHPGSGGESKNWPIENWIELGKALLKSGGARSVLVIGGEADRRQIDALRIAWRDKPFRFASHLPLPHVAALLERCSFFIGHDSGISLIAAAVGTPSLLLFGPTDPAIWAPANKNAKTIQAAGNNLEALSIETVRAALENLLSS